MFSQNVLIWRIGTFQAILQALGRDQSAHHPLKPGCYNTCIGCDQRDVAVFVSHPLVVSQFWLMIAGRLMELRLFSVKPKIIFTIGT